MRLFLKISSLKKNRKITSLTGISIVARPDDATWHETWRLVVGNGNTCFCFMQRVLHNRLNRVSNSYETCSLSAKPALFKQDFNWNYVMKSRICKDFLLLYMKVKSKIMQKFASRWYLLQVKSACFVPCSGLCHNYAPIHLLIVSWYYLCQFVFIFSLSL